MTAEQLRGDADGDLCGIVAADGEAEGADDFFEFVGLEALFSEFAEESCSLGGAADHTQKRQ